MVILDENLDSNPPVIQYASFGERFLARIIDGVIIFIPSYVIPLIFPWLYCSLLESSKSGATLGKRIIGIRVTDLNGAQIGFGPATGRFFGQILSTMIIFIGYFMMLFNTRRQTLHDMMAGTIVIRANQAFPEQRPTQGRTWKVKVDETEMHLVRITEKGGRYIHYSPLGEQTRDFTLWQLTDGMADFLDAPFGAKLYAEMKKYAEELLRTYGNRKS